MRVSSTLSKWLFEQLAGTFVENNILYVPDSYAAGCVIVPGAVNDGEIDVDEGNAVRDGKVFPLVVKSSTKTPYVVYDNMRVTYDSTKDGSYPSQLSWRVLAVERTTGAAEQLGDRVEAVLSGNYVAGLGEIDITSRELNYDPNTGDFLIEMFFKIDL